MQLEKEANQENFENGTIEPRTSVRGPATNWQLVAVILDSLEIEKNRKRIVGSLASDEEKSGRS